ncbi:MAG: FtsW/RodA/SpoVE family cell cycle protein [Candidatus Delongbacteria bacterium]|nr:FtsW/RodA/SpoVE family cell cycle protein [Candidatus Delongbacteria bacterium]
MKEIVKGTDPGIIISLTVLTGIGMLAIYSAGTARGAEDLIVRQLFWFMAGIAVIYSAQMIPVTSLLPLSNLFYLILILMLLLVILIGSEKMGAKRWIEFGYLQFQPSEIGKFLLICTLARYFSAGKIQWNDKKVFITGFLIAAIPSFLILKQPDLGSAVIYMVIFLSIIYAAGLPGFHLFNISAIFFFIFAGVFGIQMYMSALIIYGVAVFKFSKKYYTAILLILCVIGVSLSSNALWNNLKPYQQTRLLTFLDPEKFSREGGWQVVQSKTAVFNGKLTGMGFMQGSQTQLRFLPEGHNDFIFSVIAEEFGMLGIILLMSAFSYLFYRLTKIVSKTGSRYLYLLGSGITALIAIQTVLNISISVGFMPVTGLPLPFVSYGGTSLIINMFMIGIVISLGKHKKNI